MRVRTRVALAFVGAAIAVAPAVAQVTITNLPSFHYTWTGGEAINASGQVAGWATTLGPPSHAMRWTDGVPLDLGALCADCNSQATNINADGDVVGWSTTPDAIFSSQVPVIWRNGVIAALPLPDGDTRGSATGINDAGTVVGTTSGPSGNHAVIWQNGLPEVIGLGFARAINNVGQIIGSITGTGGVVIEADGSFSPLPRLPGACGTSASPIAINDAGQVVGSTSGLVMMSGFCLSVSVVWTNGSVALLPLPSGATSGFVRGINNHGDFVGEISIPGKPPEAYLWRDGDIIPLGALPFTLPVASTATGINDAGLIAGTSRIDRSTPSLTRAVTFTVPQANTPPSLNLPDDQELNADNSTGATMFFTATASDNEDGTFTASCTPASGSVFPIGTTTVSCVATDSGGLEATGSFSVTVLNAAEQIDNMLQSLGAAGPGSSLQNKLLSVLDSLQAGSGQLLSVSAARKGAASNGGGNPCASLQAFIHEVSAQGGKKLTSAQAASLIEAAQRIRAIIGC